MESYKDVMLSEPPSRFTAAPSVQPVNLETYKGILLCDRPQVAAARNEAPIPFLPAGKGEDRFIGIQPSTEQRARLQMIRSTNMSNNQPGNAIVTKHKRWLKSFAQTVQKAKLDQMESALVADARAAAYREKQATLRRQANSTQSQSQTPVDEVKPKAKPSQKESKPKWAMTAAEAEMAEEDELLTQHDDLLKFVQELDYDKFINDLEIKEAMAIMKERVEEIVAETGADWKAPLERRARGGEAKMQEMPDRNFGPSMQNGKTWNSSTRLGAGDMASQINEEALLLADKILEGSESLRQIHTRQTLAKLLRDAVDARKGTVLSTEIAPGGAVVQPTIVRVGAESTGFEAAPVQRRILTEMRKATDKAQNLPYLYRCPAL